MSTFVAGSTGFDGLFVIKPDGKMYIQSGIGNLGTESFSDTPARRGRDDGHAVGAGGRCRGATRRSSCRGRACRAAARRRTRMTRAAHAAATDAIKKVAGDRGEDARRQPGQLQAGRRAGVGQRPQHDAGPGGAEGDRARRQVRRPRAAEGHQPLHDDVGDGARRPGADGRGARQLSARRRLAIRSSPASPKSKWTSRPGTTRCSTTWRSPTSAR